MDYTESAYSFGGPGGVMRTDVAGGPPRYTLDYDRGLQQFAISMVLNKGQFSAWVAFFLHIIKKGAITFDMQLDSGFGQQTHACNIVPGTYSATRAGGDWVVVSFVVESESKTYSLSDSAVAAYGLSAGTFPPGMLPVVNGHMLIGPDGVLRDDVPGGVSAYALDWDRGLQRFDCTLILDAAKFAIWSVWYHRLIKKGAYTFTMRLDSGFGSQDHSANIVPGSYSATRSGGDWTSVSFVVEAEPKAYDLTLADAQILIETHNFYGREASYLLARINQFANVDSLVINF
jgi:hypothetical protein